MIRAAAKTEDQRPHPPISRFRANANHVGLGSILVPFLAAAGLIAVTAAVVTVFT